MKIKGKLLNYDKLLNNRFYFSKDSKIDIPEKVPLVVEFSFDDPSKVIGMCHIIRTDTGLYIEADIGDYTIEKNMGGLGGYYNNCIFRGKKIISAHLNACSITMAPIDRDCRITEVIEE